VCAPNPANVRTAVAPAVSIIDLGGDKTIATVNLAKEFDTYYNASARPDDATRRLPLHNLDIGFVPGTVTAYFASNGTDAIFRVDFDPTYQAANIQSVGDPKNAFINLIPPGVDPSRMGKMPTGVAVTHRAHPADSQTRYALVSNWATRNVSLVDLDRQEVAGLSAAKPVVASSAPMPSDAIQAAVLEGQRLFVTGLGRWSYQGQGWLACSSCHADGLSDNVSWLLGRGWRQPPSLEGSYSKKDPSDYRINQWTGTLDEPTDHEGAIRSIAGGVGAIVKDMALQWTSRLDVANQTGLNGSSWKVADPTNPAGFPNVSMLDDWQKIAMYMKNIRSPRAPSNLDPALVNEGRSLYMQANCQGCHSGDKWTISRVFYQPDTTGTLNNALITTTWTNAAQSAGFPSTLYPATTASMQTMRYGGPPASRGQFDQMTCAIRPVGTYNVAEAAVGVVELRSDGVTPAQGNETDGKGYNVPSLLGMSLGAPYLHAGQVRTLEALFTDTFGGHHKALAPTFLDALDPQRDHKVAALVQYVLSIDNDTPAIPIPALGPGGGVLCATP
jgi:cytochrome c peroxidase